MTWLNKRTALLLLLAMLGAAAGALLQPASVQADPGCENDECELGRWCRDNPGGSTECGHVGRGCQTIGCGG